MPMRVAGAQLNLVVGDIPGNETKIGQAMDWAEREGADVLLLPELAISGYPPEDLLLRSSFVEDGLEALGRLARRSGETTTVLGLVDYADREVDGDDCVPAPRVANAAAVIGGGQVLGIYHKALLPNYGVFDEDRYFVPGSDGSRIWEIAGTSVGVSVCEDIWRSDGPPSLQAQSGAEILLNINASPYHRGKAAERQAMLSARASDNRVPVAYVNLVGGQDELVFEGASVLLAANGTVLHRSPQFEEDLFVVDVPLSTEPVPVGTKLAPLLDPTAEVYEALTVAARDYVGKNGFDSVIVGLSGGIDSALTATIAVDALGPDAVVGVGMPSRYSSQHSIDDARELAKNLGIRFELVPIDEVFSSYLSTLGPLFDDTAEDVTEENLQARIRGAILMALSNKFGHLVLATGNKSELAVGYSTLYGDMVGGYAVIKDVFKSLVYELAEWRNRDEIVIPVNTIHKPPSAELRPDQLDSDSLPPYSILDAILDLYVEDDMGVDGIVGEGFDRDLVLRVVSMVDRSEYKRRQAAPGVKITVKAFGKDRRLPITNKYRHGEVSS